MGARADKWTRGAAMRQSPRRGRVWIAAALLLQLALVACSGTPTTAPSPTGVATATATPTHAAIVTAVADATVASTPTPTAPPSPAANAPAASPARAVPTAGPPGPVTLRVPASAQSTALTQTRTLTVPGGFHVAVFAAGLPAARLLAWSPEGDLVVTQTLGDDGKVVILPDRNRDGAADRAVVFAAGLRRPHGLAFHAGYLYVAEEASVIRFAWRGGQPAAGAPEVVVRDLPAGAGHSTRTLGFGPDGKMYVSIGSSCNVCAEQDQRRATIMQYNADGSGGRVYAKGLRNAVGFTWRPGADELWATNNGRDNLGDNSPPETVNLVRDGADFGWPYCHNGHIPDPQYARLGSCDKVTKPAVEMQAHSAPLGLAFYDGAAFPADYRGDLLVAFHGSWNRSVPTGYKVVRVRFQDGRPTGQVEDFVTGWLQPDGHAWGRPVAPLVAPDGSVYLTDDTLGVIYRITYAP